MRTLGGWGWLGGALHHERARLARRLSDFAGEPLLMGAALRAEFIDTRRRWLRRRTQARAERLLFALEDGAALPEAMADHPGDFQAWEIELARAAGGAREPARPLRAWSELLRDLAELGDGLSVALLYPLQLLVVSWVLVAVVASTVLPTVESILGGFGLELPASTLVLLAAHRAMPGIGGLLLTGGAAVALGWALRGAWPVLRRWSDAALLRSPLLGAMAVRRARAFVLEVVAALLESGRPLPEAFEAAAGAQPNTALAQELERLAALLSAGTALADAPRGRWLDPCLRRRLARALEAREPGPVLRRLATAYRRSGQRRLDAAVQVIEPLGIAVLGAGVGLAAVGTMAPYVAILGAMMEGP